MTSTLCPVTRVVLPADVAAELKFANAVGLNVPAGYVNFHEGLAEKRLNKLRDAYGFRVIETKMVRAGWFDGMRELNAIIETKRGSLHKLVWCDSNQDFMEKYSVGGSGSYNADELFLGKAA